ncbi:hypothetical protein TNIN_331901 [Trichonephila inaurata madagascariensis]|uniref:Uncharacterized protein n=1 Tax=Trichonephila inaurata madagascariensis TaxID=2747483 RepID=A0A8X6J5F7_9ARAC|nr:hypothetical protein TNIN_331901 [Trichonephila inaurata madagascariensis]
MQSVSLIKSKQKRNYPFFVYLSCRCVSAACKPCAAVQVCASPNQEGWLTAYSESSKDMQTPLERRDLAVLNSLCCKLKKCPSVHKPSFTPFILL